LVGNIEALLWWSRSRERYGAVQIVSGSGGLRRASRASTEFKGPSIMNGTVGLSLGPGTLWGIYSIMVDDRCSARI